MAMLAACHEVRASFEVASLDHGFRPEARSELELVRSFCSARGLTVHTRQLDLEKGAGLEERAREARYLALGSIARSRGLRWIATAHTASDQAETVLMRLIRGTSPRGVAGVLPTRADGVFRPLLFATRADTLGYVAARGVPFVSDPMNDDPAFLRTRIRQEVMPALERVAGPHLTERIAQFAAFVSEDDALLSAEAESALVRIRVGAELDLHALRSLTPPIQRRVLATWLLAQGVPLDAHHLDDAREAIASGRTATLPRDLLLTTDGARVRVVPSPPRLHGSSSGDDGRARK